MEIDKQLSAVKRDIQLVIENKKTLGEFQKSIKDQYGIDISVDFNTINQAVQSIVNKIYTEHKGQTIQDFKKDGDCYQYKSQENDSQNQDCK